MNKPTVSSTPTTYRLAMISNQAFSLSNFRGELIRELTSRGVQVFALAPDFDEASRRAVQLTGALPIDYSLSRTGLNPLKDIVDMFLLARRLRALKINIAFSYFIKPVIYGTLAAAMAGVAARYAMIEGAGYVFADTEQHLSWKRRVLRSTVKWMYRISLARATGLFLLNADDQDLFVREKMARPEQVRLINGIGLNLAHYRPTALVMKPVCFILVARLIREKGIFEYVAAARIVKSKHPATRFLLVGDIDLNPSSISEAQCRAWVQEGIVEWPGHVADIRVWLAKASVFVLPSYYREGLPRSTQEAMAMGRPVITTDLPGCRETVTDGVNGFMVPARDVEALSEAMLKFVEHPELITTMGRESERMAQEKYDVHQINAAILQYMKL